MFFSQFIIHHLLCNNLFSCSLAFSAVSYMSTEKISLKIASEYKYLRQSNCYTITGVDDAERFRVVTVCFWLPIFLHIAFFLRFFLFCVEIIFFTYEFAYGLTTFRKLWMLFMSVRKTKRVYLQCLLQYCG